MFNLEISFFPSQLKLIVFLGGNSMTLAVLPVDDLPLLYLILNGKPRPASLTIVSFSDVGHTGRHKGNIRETINSLISIFTEVHILMHIYLFIGHSYTLFVLSLRCLNNSKHVQKTHTSLI